MPKDSPPRRRGGRSDAGGRGVRERGSGGPRQEGSEMSRWMSQYRGPSGSGRGGRQGWDKEEQEEGAGGGGSEEDEGGSPRKLTMEEMEERYVSKGLREVC